MKIRKELIQELRTIREECTEQSRRIARILGELCDSENAAAIDKLPKASKRLLHYIEGVLQEGASFDEKDIERILREELAGAEGKESP